MRCFFNQISDITLVDGMKEAPELNQQFPQKVSYQGRAYSLCSVYARTLSRQEKLSAFFECLAKTILSLGLLLFSADLLDKWQSVFAARYIRAVYLPDENVERRAEADTATNREASTVVPESPIKLPVPSGVSASILPIGLALNKLPIEEGINPFLLDAEGKLLLASLVDRWFKSERPVNPSWKVKDLADLLAVKEQDLHQLLDYLQLFTSPAVPLHVETLNWLFRSIQDAVEDKPRATMQFGVKAIWKPRAMVAGIENRYPLGMDRQSWKLRGLSLFLAVKEEALRQFLITKGVEADQEGNYASSAIDYALKHAENSEINTLLNKQRTQQKSLRFAAN